MAIESDAKESIKIIRQMKTSRDTAPTPRYNGRGVKLGRKNDRGGERGRGPLVALVSTLVSLGVLAGYVAFRDDIQEAIDGKLGGTVQVVPYKDSGVAIDKHPYANSVPVQVKPVLPKDYDTEDGMFRVRYTNEKACIEHTPTIYAEANDSGTSGEEIELGDMKICFGIDSKFYNPEGTAAQRIDTRIIVDKFSRFKSRTKRGLVAANYYSEEEANQLSEADLAKSVVTYLTFTSIGTCSAYRSAIVGAADRLVTAEHGAGAAPVSTPDPGAVAINWMDAGEKAVNTYTCVNQ